MQAQNVARAVGQSRQADVAMPQTGALGIFSFYSRSLWAIVHVDQSQVVYPSEEGPAQSTALKKNRSRGCRALKLPFLHCAWLRLSPLAPSQPKKLCTSMNLRSPSSQPIPASTSNHWGRAVWACARPALFLSDMAPSARCHRPHNPGFALGFAPAYGSPLSKLLTRRPLCGQHPFLPSFLLPLLRPAPNRCQSLCQSKNRLRLNQPRPESISDLTGRAGSYRPAPFARPSFAKVRTC